MEKKFRCPAQEEYNVFGVPDKPCCFKYHKYCEDVEGCDWKELINELEGLERNK